MGNFISSGWVTSLVRGEPNNWQFGMKTLYKSTVEQKHEKLALATTAHDLWQWHPSQTNNAILQIRFEYEVS